MLSSDDAWYPEKLEIQVEYLEQHPEIGAVFGKVDWVDETGQIIANKNFPYTNLFEVSNRSRFEWLSYFFLQRQLFMSSLQSGSPGMLSKNRAI